MALDGTENLASKFVRGSDGRLDLGTVTTTSTLAAATSGGTSISRTISAGSTNATVVKASAGQVYAVHVNNANAALRYLKLYNKATAPTVGSDTPVVTLQIPIGGVADLRVLNGAAFSAGISFALTTGLADSDTGAVSANEHIVNIFYK